MNAATELQDLSVLEKGHHLPKLQGEKMSIGFCGKIFKSWTQIIPSAASLATAAVGTYFFVTGQYLPGGICMGVTAALCFSCLTIRHYKPVHDLNNAEKGIAKKNSELEENNKNLFTKVSELETLVSQMKSQVTAEAALDTSIKNDLGTQEINLSNVSQRIEKTVADLKVIQEVVNQFKEILANIYTGLNATKGNVNSLNEVVSKVSQAILNVDATQKKLELSQKDLESGVAKFEIKNGEILDYMKQLDTILKGIIEKFQELQQTNSQISQELIDLKKDISDLSNIETQYKNMMDKFNQTSNDYQELLSKCKELEEFGAFINDPVILEQFKAFLEKEISNLKAAK